MQEINDLAIVLALGVGDCLATSHHSITSSRWTVSSQGLYFLYTNGPELPVSLWPQTLIHEMLRRALHETCVLGPYFLPVSPINTTCLRQQVLEGVCTDVIRSTSQRGLCKSPLSESTAVILSGIRIADSISLTLHHGAYSPQGRNLATPLRCTHCLPYLPEF